MSGLLFHGLKDIIQEQRDLDWVKKDLDNKCQHVSDYWSHEIKRMQRKIFQEDIRQEDLVQLQKQNMQLSNEKGNVVFEFKDTLVDQLREILKSNTTLPDHACNVLQLYLEDREKQKSNEIEKSSKKIFRLKNQKLDLIKKEFEANHGSNRATQILIAMLKHLKFFVRFSDQDRTMILENAVYLRVPARTTIFLQDDEGENMYVILKGRVVVEKKSPESGNLPIVVAILKDGDHFGELGLIDQDKLDHQIHALEGDRRKGHEHIRFAKRKASCITTEETDLLVLNKEICTELYQSEKNTEFRKQVEEYTSQGVDQDELATKI